MGCCGHCSLRDLKGGGFFCCFRSLCFGNFRLLRLFRCFWFFRSFRFFWCLGFLCCFQCLYRLLLFLFSTFRQYLSKNEQTLSRKRCGIFPAMKASATAKIFLPSTSSNFTFRICAATMLAAAFLASDLDNSPSLCCCAIRSKFCNGCVQCVRRRIGASE